MLLRRVLTGKLEGILVRCDYRMLRYMAKVRWQDSLSNEEVQRRCGVEDLGDRLRRARLRWFGHVRRKEGHIQVWRRAVELEVVGKRMVRRPRKTWRQEVKENLRHLSIREDMVDDRQSWRRLIALLTPAVGQDRC